MAHSLRLLQLPEKITANVKHLEVMKVLITEAEIQERVCDLGARLSDKYAGRSLTVLGVLTGSIVLLADLIRATSIPLRVALIEASSYGETRTEPGELTINNGLVPDLKGRDVVILDDIFDTGNTMVGLYAAVQSFEPASIQSAVLLWKTARTVVDLKPDHFCFQIPDEFVVGYGLDYNDEFRNLLHVVLHRERLLDHIAPVEQLQGCANVRRHNGTLQPPVLHRRAHRNLACACQCMYVLD